MHQRKWQRLEGLVQQRHVLFAPVAHPIFLLISLASTRLIVIIGLILFSMMLIYNFSITWRNHLRIQMIVYLLL